MKTFLILSPFVTFFRKIVKKIAFMTLLINTTACYQLPDYDKVPSINFEKITSVSTANGEDNIQIQLSYRDGDGDVGNSVNDTSNNFFATLYRQENGVFKVVMITETINGVTTTKEVRQANKMGILGTNEARPIDGVIKFRWQQLYNVNLAGTQFPTFIGDTIRFEVYITDRSKNKSNTITTDPVILGVSKP
jgi:hypothetical protein